MLIKYRAWSGAIGHMLFDFGIANLSLVGYFFKKWQTMSLMISILPFSKAILICPSVLPLAPLRERPRKADGISGFKNRGKVYLFFVSFYQNQSNFFILVENMMKGVFILSHGINLSHFRFLFKLPVYSN